MHASWKIHADISTNQKRLADGYNCACVTTAEYVNKKNVFTCEDLYIYIVSKQPFQIISASISFLIPPLLRLGLVKTCAQNVVQNFLLREIIDGDNPSEWMAIA